MIKKFLFNLIKNDKRIRKEFINELTQEEKCRVLEKMDYDKLIVNTEIKNKTIIDLDNSILVNCRIEECNIEGGNFTGNIMYSSYITNNRMMSKDMYKPLPNLPKLDKNKSIL